VRRIDQRLRGRPVEPGQADLEPRGEREAFGLVAVEVDFGIDRSAGGQCDAGFLCGKAERTLEAGRPARREQLLGIGAGARGAGRAELDVELAIGAFCGAVAAADGVDMRGVKGLAGHKILLGVDPTAMDVETPDKCGSGGK